MIVRIWRGYADHGEPDAYPEHFRRNVVPELRGIAGFLGATLLKRETEDIVEFLVETRWQSLDAIRAFAGDDIERAIVEPEAVAALRTFDPTVSHFDAIQDVQD